MIAEPPKQCEEGPRYGHIDSLRAIAALVVVVMHITYSLEYPVVRWLDATADFGRVGVVLFFAVSGFVIPSSLRGPRTEGARRFLIRRFFRLYPAYWLSIIAIAIVFGRLWSGTWPDAATLAANFSMVQEFLGYPSIIGLYWTLQTELVFYGICLTVFMFGGIDKPKMWIAIIAATGLLGWLWMKSLSFMSEADAGAASQTGMRYLLAQYFVGAPRNTWGNARFLLIVHLSIMALGALLRLWYEGNVRTRSDRLCLFGVLGYWIALHSGPTFVTDVPLGDWSVARTHLSYTIPVAAFALFACVIPIRSRALGYVGTISYSLYLFHPIPLFLFLTIVRESPTLAAIPSLPRDCALLALSVGLAALLYALVEKPAIDLGHRLSWRNPRFAA